MVCIQSSWNIFLGPCSPLPLCSPRACPSLPTPPSPSWHDASPRRTALYRWCDHKREHERAAHGRGVRETLAASALPSASSVCTSDVLSHSRSTCAASCRIGGRRRPGWQAVCSCLPCKCFCAAAVSIFYTPPQCVQTYRIRGRTLYCARCLPPRTSLARHPRTLADLRRPSTVSRCIM
jgi:hypothetical protein